MKKGDIDYEKLYKDSIERAKGLKGKWIDEDGEYGKYVDECLNEAAKHFFSEGEDTYSVADLFYAGVRCGKSWVEKQGEQSIKWNKNTEGNKPQKNHSVLIKTTHGIAEGEWNGGEHWIQYRWSGSIKDSDVLFWIELSDIKEQGEQKPVNTVEPRFKIYDKVIHKKTGKIWTIHWYLADTNSYYVVDEEKLIHHYTEDELESAELWFKKGTFWLA